MNSFLSKILPEFEDSHLLGYFFNLETLAALTPLRLQ